MSHGRTYDEQRFSPLDAIDRSNVNRLGLAWSFATGDNRGMEATLQKEPEYFWYYNNGITIVCDEAKQESSRGRQILRVTNPQVINGQQTTRTLAARRREAARWRGHSRFRTTVP